MSEKADKILNSWQQDPQLMSKGSESRSYSSDDEYF